MEGERKVRWRRLLKHIRGNAPKRMPPAWAQEASERLAAVGIEDFNEQLALWFVPFRSGEPLPLSIPGSHVLKGLVWYVAVSGDETAKQTALWLLDVKWKQKRNMEKSMTALEVLGISEKELLDRNLIVKPPTKSPEQQMEQLSEISELWGKIRFSEVLNNPEKSVEVMEKLKEELRQPNTPLKKQLSEALQSMAAPNMVVDHAEDMMVVQGEQHFYRLFLSTGQIERVTDNAELELNWEKIPDQTRMSFDREDYPQQRVMSLATFLMRDSIYAHYFRVKSKK